MPADLVFFAINLYIFDTLRYNSSWNELRRGAAGMVDYVALGRRMKLKRREMKMSQEEMAKAVQISMSFYGNIERGKRIPSIDTLVAIANVLDVGTDYLLAESVTAAYAQRSPEELRLLRRYLREKVAELDYSGLQPGDML